MFLIFMFVVRHNGRACAFRDTQQRGCAARSGGIEVQTRQPFGVPSQGVLIESSDKVVLEQQFEVKAAKVREEYLAALLEVHTSEANGTQHAHHS
jgi:hypothetical protein